MDYFDIRNEDCIEGAKALPRGSVHLGIYDPPFGINEADFNNKYYKRDCTHVLPGYKEAPDNYESFTYQWMTQAKELLHDNGSMYVFSGYTNLRHVLNAAHYLGLHEINHCIWKFNFGPCARRKFITSHYHLLYYSKSEKAKVTFNTYCRFGQQETSKDGKRKLLNIDMEDVFVINKEYAPNETKNSNKLPKELIQKLVQYSSNEGDIVCDFFMGNFTTAYAALGLGRKAVGFELNKLAYQHHMEKLKEFEFGCDLKGLRKPDLWVPENQGKPVSPEEQAAIFAEYNRMLGEGMKKKDISVKLQGQFKRGRFGIKNILDECLLSVC